MNTRSKLAAAFGLAAALTGCATTEKATGGVTPTTPWADCSNARYEGPIAETAAPRNWHPEPGPRGYLHIHFMADDTNVFAIGVPVGEHSAVGTPFVVGPMKGDIKPFPEYPEKAHEMLKQNQGGWYEFYQALFHGYARGRPMGLVCPDGQDCRTTPEGPPPYLSGMTSTYSTGPIAALAPDPGVRYAELQAAAPGITVTDALMAQPTTDPNDPRAAKRRDLVSAVVIRAVCASKVLTVAPR